MRISVVRFVVDTYETVAASIRRVFPDSQIEPASEEQLIAIHRDYPDAPDHYSEFLRRVGWGRLGRSNFMIYSGLIGPDEVFDENTTARVDGVVLLGDNFSGWVIGFDTRAGWRLVGVYAGSVPEPLGHDTLSKFIAQRVADSDDTESR